MAKLTIKKGVKIYTEWEEEPFEQPEINYVATPDLINFLIDKKHEENSLPLENSLPRIRLINEIIDDIKTAVILEELINNAA